MKIFSPLIFFILTSTCGLKSQSWIVKMDSIMQAVEKQEMFHGQILIAEQGQILFSKAYGLIDKSKNEKPISVSTPLSIQSVTKSFTALSTLILQSRGLLELDDQLIDYFPALPYEGVTLRHLLTMTSGLPRFLSTAIKYGDTTKTMSNDEIIELVANHQPIGEKPGQNYSYNNTNYLLLASIIEKVTDNSYSDFVGNNIFKPLKMDNSYVADVGKIPSFEKINSSNFYNPYGEGNIYSTAEDLYLFDQSLYSDKLVPLEIFMESFKETKLTDGKVSNYGFSWRVSDSEIKTETYIVGEGENTRCSIQRYMDDNKSLIYIHNFSGTYWKQVYGAVRNIWEGKEYITPVKRFIYAINTDLYKTYEGKYLSKKFGLLHVSKEDGKLFLRPDPIPGKEQLIPSSETTFYFTNQDIEWEFFKDNVGNVIGLGIKGDRGNMGVKQEDIH